MPIIVWTLGIVLGFFLGFTFCKAVIWHNWNKETMSKIIMVVFVVHIGRRQLSNDIS